MKIEVTQDDIDKGQASNCVSCPIALALKRQCPEFATVNVKYSFAFFWSNPTNWKDMDYKPVGDCVAELPFEARKFIGRFDIGLPVEPFEFELEIKGVENPVFRTDVKVEEES